MTVLQHGQINLFGGPGPFGDGPLLPRSPDQLQCTQSSMEMQKQTSGPVLEYHLSPGNLYVS